VKFKAIYDEHKKMVFNLALQYVKNIEEAEEITQDVFVSISQNNSKFNNHSKLSTWIYRITINKSLDYIKAKKSQKRHGFISSLFWENTNEVKIEIGDFNHPGVILEQQEATKRIFDAINQLNDNQKTVIVLSKIEQKTQKEIAEIMKLSTSAVESLLGRVKLKLEEILRNNEG
jgi:RNA polymerase sigma-70 factor (ECF subfamily)